MYRWILAVVMMAWASVAGAQNVRTYIPPQAFTHKAAIAKELDTHFSQLHERNYVPSLIEHESCITLKHSRCWSSTAQLKSARERGVGLGQVTIAYHQDGTVRFDSLNEMRTRYKQALYDANWDTIHQRPDIQIRLIVLMLRDSWNRLGDVKNLDSRMAFMDAAYNGGLGGVNKERRQCSLTKGCDYTQWFGHVEKVCLKSKKPLYAGRSACDINRHHVQDVLHTKLPKYKRLYGL